MKLDSFLRFSAPSFGLMIVLLAIPLVYSVYLSLLQCTDVLELVTVRLQTPFGVSELTTQRARVGADGLPEQMCQFVWFEQYTSVLRSEFAKALHFTMLYVVVTVPLVIIGGLVLALATTQIPMGLRGFAIGAALLPFIVTPLVGALSIKWLFRDDGLVTQVLNSLGIQIFWMAEAWSARLLVILHGIWHSLPFAFIVLFAGLQSVPRDALEAASLDGASPLQRLWYVTLPHLGPLVTFILLIHTMDAYKLFEPVVVLTQGTFTESVQFVTYSILLEEGNANKASAAAILTILGVAILLIPMLRRAVQEHKAGAA